MLIIIFVVLPDIMRNFFFSIKDCHQNFSKRYRQFSCFFWSCNFQRLQYLIHYGTLETFSWSKMWRILSFFCHFCKETTIVNNQFSISGIAIFASMVNWNCSYSPFTTTYISIWRTFSQHWIVVGGSLRVLLLDFDGKFNLLIPNIEIGKAFR